MITRIELKNFQAHKDTALDFDKGINVICGETDNGKSAIIRAIRWVAENYPSGTDIFNSRWNKDFKEPLSVKLYTENGYVERIRTKTRNGYNVCKNGEPEIKLDAIGKGVPKEVSNFLNMSEVSFQFQYDSPYLISMTSGQASQYLNELVHLDSIDNIMSIADSDKRELSSEQKNIEKDLKEFTEQYENLSWVDDADVLCKRTGKLYEMVQEGETNYNTLKDSLESYEGYDKEIIDLSEYNKLVKKIEDIQIQDYNELESSIGNYEECSENVFDVSEGKKIVGEIDSIIITDTDELEKSLISYYELKADLERFENQIEDLKNKLPEICPYCGNKLNKEQLNVC